MESRLLLIGGGGNCKSILDVLLDSDEYSEIGIIDKDPNTIPLSSDKIKYVGNDGDLPSLFESGWKRAFISIGSVGNPDIRIKIYDYLKKIGFTLPNVISQRAIVSARSCLGEGVFVSKGSVINAGTRIGNCCIINSNSTIEHDCSIGSFVHVSPGAVICGGVVVGDNTHIGANASIKQYVTIGKDSIIGMGSVVTKNIASNAICYGNPCKYIKRNGD